MRTAVLSTSIDAYHAHCGSGQCSMQRQRILDFIAHRGGDWSIWELSQAMSLQKSTVSARVHELLHGSHELVDRPKRKDRVSGITVRPVGLPATGCQGRLF